MHRQRRAATDTDPEEVLPRRQVREIEGEILDERLDPCVSRCRRRSGRLTNDLRDVGNIGKEESLGLRTRRRCRYEQRQQRR